MILTPCLMQKEGAIKNVAHLKEDRIEMNYKDGTIKGLRFSVS